MKLPRLAAARLDEQQRRRRMFVSARSRERRKVARERVWRLPTTGGVFLPPTGLVAAGGEQMSAASV